MIPLQSPESPTEGWNSVGGGHMGLNTVLVNTSGLMIQKLSIYIQSFGRIFHPKRCTSEAENSQRTQCCKEKKQNINFFLPS